MYSGGDSSGDGVNSRNQFNWQITSQTSCNVNSGGVIDWASLAQQWIQMKDSGAGLPDTPPPPIISANTKSNKITKFDEQGEADMEVEKEDEQQIVGFGQTITSSQTENLNTGRWFPPQDTVPYCAPQQNQWTSWSTRVTLPPPALHVPITTGSLTPPIPKEIVPSTTPPLKGIPNLPKHPSEMTSMLPNKESLELPPMDAAKRKILPAWIREGLEKMEREKLKQLERGHKDKDPSIAGTPTADSDINSKIKTMVKNSIMEMEGESSGNEAAVATKSPAPYDVDTDREVASASTQLLTSVPQERVNSLSGKTYEERMADMMIAVRKTLTELLLEVTNEEISSIAYEAIRKRRAKASSAQVIRKSAITSITGKLGLEAYADSDTDNSASDNDTNNDESRRSDDENDSEEEFKANIRICKRAFAKTVEEIEERIQAAAAREEMLLRERQKRNSRDHAVEARRSPMHKSKGFDKEIGEPQPDKKSNSNGKRRKERTSRFSDNKDSRNRAATNYFPVPSISSGNLSSQAVPGSGSSGNAPTNVTSAKYKVNNASASSSLAAPLPNDKRSSSSYSANKLSKPTPTATSSTTSKHHRHSDSPSNSSDSSSSGTRSSHSRRSKYSASRHKRSSTERSKRSHCSNSYRSSRRRDSSDSNDNDHYKKHRQATTTSSSLYSRRHGRRRSDSRSSRSRTRSRSRSRSTTYSSSRRTDRY